MIYPWVNDEVVVILNHMAGDVQAMRAGSSSFDLTRASRRTGGSGMLADVARPDVSVF